VIVLADTGARVGEITSLKWQHVQFEDGRPVRILLTKTKGRRTRGIPLTKAAADVLLQLGPRAPELRVFQHDSPKKSWSRARRLAGVPRCRIHDLRHFAASRLIRRGVNLLVVRRVLGHSTPALTARYAAIRDDTLAQAMAMLD
jgi:integrase